MDKISEVAAIAKFFKIPPGICETTGIPWEALKVSEVYDFVKACKAKGDLSEMADQAARALGVEIAR